MYFDWCLENIDNPLKTISKIISALLNPLLVAPISFGIIIYFDGTIDAKNPLFLTSFFFTSALPLITIFYFKHLGKISSLDAPIKEQRIQLLAIAAIYNALGFLLLSYLEAPPIVRGLMFCYALNTAIVWRITMLWKISIHMIGLGGPIVALWLAGFEYPLAMGFTLMIVSISRVVLKAHTPSQVIVGTMLAMGLALLELTYLFL
jgi:membrane-associated phospholipid phosphatase